MLQKYILIVEDESIISLSIIMKLKQSGYKTELRTNPKEAIEAVRTTKPDLILMDINLNDEIDGIETVNEIRKFDDVPVIYLTALSDEDTLKRAQKSKPAGFLIKPIDERELFTNVSIAISNYLDQKTKASEEKYKTLFEKMSQGVLYRDSEGRVISANPAALNIIGLSMEELCGTSPMDKKCRIIREDGSEYTPEEHPAMVALREKREINNVIKGIFNCNENRFRWVEISAIPLFNPGEEEPFQVITTAVDITEKKAIEDKLRVFSRAVEQNPVSIVIADKNGNVEYVNPRYSEMSSYSFEEATGADSKVFRPEDLQKAEYKRMAEWIDGGLVWKGELCSRKKTGEEYWHEVSISAVRNEKNEITHYLAVGEETTEKRIIEQQLIESEERYRKLVEMSPDIIAVHSEGKLIFVNETGLKMFGITDQSEILNKPVLDFVHPDSHRVAMERIAEMTENGMCTPFTEEKFIAPDGRVNTFEVASVPTTYKGKLAFQIIARDIEDRKKAESALRLSEEMFRTLFEYSPIGISIVRDGVILKVNPAHARMFGFNDPKELKDSPAINRIAPEYRYILANRIAMKENGKDANMSCDSFAVKSDGTIFPVHVDFSDITLSDGKADIVLLTDITELRNREENIQASLKEKEILLKEIHHRVKNNLQIISSLLSLQSEYIKDPEAFRLFTESMHRVKSMAIIHEKLYQSENLSRIEAYDYINELVSYLHRTYMSSTGFVKVDIDVDDIQLLIDTAIPGGLIINELVTNSFKYAFPKGRDGEIKISFKRNNSDYILIVSDNGIGIPEDVDYMQTESLGFMLVSNLVEQLRGTIKLEKSKGTKFIMTFPRIK